MVFDTTVIKKGTKLWYIYHKDTPAFDENAKILLEHFFKSTEKKDYFVNEYRIEKDIKVNFITSNDFMNMERVINCLDRKYRLELTKPDLCYGDQRKLATWLSDNNYSGYLEYNYLKMYELKI